MIRRNSIEGSSIISKIMYTKVSIPKNGDGAGCPVSKSSNIIIIDVDDIKTEPTREVGNTALKGDLELETDAKAVAIYATPTTISETEEYSGDADARGVKQGLEFEHPGNSSAVKGFSEAFMNRGEVILVTDCDGTAAGRTQMFGRKCNPLFMSIERTGNNEANKRKFTFKQELNDKFLPGDYSGAMPAVAEAAKAAETV